MDLKNRPGLDESLTDDEFDRLEALLDSFPGEDAMDIEEMDGFFAALISGPTTVPPSVYLEEIFGGERAPLATQKELQEFMDLAMRHWNSIAQALMSKELVFMPWLIVDEGEEVPRGNGWARGFMRGVALCEEEWQEVFRDEDKFAMLLPVLALAHEDDPDEEMRT